MLLKRYVSRPFLRALQYFIVVCGLFILYSFFFYPLSQESSSQEIRNIRHPGAFTGHEDVELQVEDGADPFVQYRNLPKKDWNMYDLMTKDSLRQGLGEAGKPVKLDLTDAEKEEQDKLYRANGYNAMVSDLIALDRSPKDVRHKLCKNIQYLEKLPGVSVIFPFHDEHNTTLLRSVHSVILRSPKELLKEIILVDDNSTKPFLKEPLEDYLRKNNLERIVKVVRTRKREGLIRARQIGAQHSTADIMVFLDAHSEVNYNWLPPLIEPVAFDYKTVVCPFVDVIDCDTYEYRPQDEGARDGGQCLGSFDWEFNYKRLPLTEDDLKHPTRPFKSPVMAGGYFAISRKWFWELGGYDEGLDIWGGEQYELSFKVWQCHGNMVDTPCSRVGHIYRCKHVPFPNPGVGDFISRNYRRVAEVWMDEYAEHLYKRRPALRTVNAGDLTKQKAVRERLKCKSFDWFMKEVAFDQDKYYPAIEPNDTANGELRNMAAEKCVDTQNGQANDRFTLKECNAGGFRSEQYLRLTFRHDVRPRSRNVCFDASSSAPRAPVILYACHGMRGNQQFKYLPDTSQMYHPISNQCLDCDPQSGEIFMNPCDEQKLSQRWNWTHMDKDIAMERNKQA